MIVSSHSVERMNEPRTIFADAAMIVGAISMPAQERFCVLRCRGANDRRRFGISPPGRALAWDSEPASEAAQL